MTGMTVSSLRRSAAGGWSACRLAALLLLVLALLLVPAGQACAGVRAAILVNMKTGKILYERNGNLSIPPASLTKLMTMYLALDAVRDGRISLQQPVRVTREASRAGGSRMQLRANQRVSLSNLLMGMMVASGNDAALAVAHALSGNSTRRFVQMMNRKARALRLTRTVFKNPNGLPAAGQKTTARDMMRLALSYLRTHPSSSRYHGTRYFTYGGRTMRNTNRLLGKVLGVNGLKTGFTAASGYNIIVTAERKGVKLMVVVLGGSSRVARDRMAYRLLETGFKYPASPTRVQRAMGSRRR